MPGEQEFFFTPRHDSHRRLRAALCETAIRRLSLYCTHSSALRMPRASYGMELHKEENASYALRSVCRRRKEGRNKEGANASSRHQVEFLWLTKGIFSSRRQQLSMIGQHSKPERTFNWTTIIYAGPGITRGGP